MKRTLMTAAAACALTLGLAGCASLGMTDEATVPASADDDVAAAAADAMEAAALPTAADATAFVATAETRLAALSEEAARIQWSRATNITYDTMWLESRVNAEYTELQVELANGAAAFNGVE